MSKQQQSSPAVTPQSEAEALVVQHALAFYRDMKRNAQNAPIGFSTAPKPSPLPKAENSSQLRCKRSPKKKSTTPKKKRNETLQDMPQAKTAPGWKNKKDRNRRRNHKS